MGEPVPEAMLETFHWFRGEGFSLIVEDLLRLPPRPGVIAEGFRLLPRLVKPLLAVPEQAVWLLPTPEFSLAALDSRGSLLEIAQRTSDPERAPGNLLSPIGCSLNASGGMLSASGCASSRSAPR